MKEELDYSRYFWQGEKTILRPFRLDDADASFINSLDSPSRQLLQFGIELPTSPEILRTDLEKRVDCKDAGNVILFAIEILSGVKVGGISYHSRDRKNGTFGFGIVVDREYWKNGYALDAARILLRYAFWERRYQKCNSGCIHTNVASIRLHKKLGFQQEGCRRQSIYFNGHYYDDLLFGLTRDEFDAQEKLLCGMDS